MAKVLLVEDDPLMVNLYRKIFQLENVDLDITDRAEKALSYAREHKPELILMDVMMPEMDGFQALKILKADPDTKDIKVVMLTNLAGAQDAQEAKKDGAEDYVIKSEHNPKDVVDIAKRYITSS